MSVLLVLLFHLDIEAFKFGYLGVDVFFLISGFLMPIILPKYDAWGYIKARVSRLLPALSVVVLVTLVLGYFFQLPGEYLNLSISSLSSFAFLSQFYFIFNTGYFDQDSIYQPLLHTWSLGNEFLAYIVVFLALLLFPKNKLKLFSLILTLVSFLYIVIFLSYSEINYFDPIPRMFLFFFAFYFSSSRNNFKISDKFLFLTSFVFLVVIFSFFSKDITLKLWPNYSIFLLPGVILPLMFLNRPVTPVSILNRILKKVGDWSYSIYIWHWPIIAFERIYFRNAHINYKEVLLLFGISFLFGIFSFQYIERNKRVGVTGFIVAVILISGVWITDGASYRTPSSLNKYSSVELMTDYDYFVSHEKIDNISIYKIAEGVQGSGTVVIGDSHSRHILPVYKEGYDGSIFRISLQPDKVNDRWGELREVFDELGADKIIFAYRLYKKNPNDVEKLMQNINEPEFNENYNVVVIRDIPSFDGDPIACLFANQSQLMFKGCGFDIKNGLPKDKVFNDPNPVWQVVVKNASDRIKIIDTHDALCDGKHCLTMIDNEFILRDSNHFNEKMSSTVNAKLYKLFFLDEHNISSALSM